GQVVIVLSGLQVNRTREETRGQDLRCPVHDAVGRQGIVNDTRDIGLRIGGVLGLCRVRSIKLQQSRGLIVLRNALRGCACRLDIFIVELRLRGIELAELAAAQKTTILQVYPAAFQRARQGVVRGSLVLRAGRVRRLSNV